VNSSYPAVDFLRKVEVWQQDPGGTAGIAVLLPANEEMTLEQLLASVRRDGASARLEAQARYWLIGYREANPPLTAAQRSELDTLIAGAPVGPSWRALADSPPPGRRRYTLRDHLNFRSPRSAALIGAAVLFIAVVIAVGITLWGAAHPANPAPAGGTSQQQVQQQVPAGTTDLQNVESDWGPFTQLPASQADPQTGAPALLLLNAGGYYASQHWTVPAGDPGWTPDLSGSVASRDVHGNYVVITDADGNTWVVGTGQPFILASNPGTVLQVDRAGNVLSIPESHAVSSGVRRPIR
jgi:hypothetical protein